MMKCDFHQKNLIWCESDVLVMMNHTLDLDSNIQAATLNVILIAWIHSLCTAVFGRWGLLKEETIESGQVIVRAPG